MTFTRKMFRILTKRILTCLFKKGGLFSILVQNSPKLTKKVLVFRKVAKSCSLTKKLLKTLKVAKSCRAESGKAYHVVQDTCTYVDNIKFQNIIYFAK